MVSYQDKIAITACSNAFRSKEQARLDELDNILKEIGLVAVYSKYIVCDGSPVCKEPKEKAKELMDYYLNPEVKAIFDISGGNLANEMIDIIDYDLICKHTKPFFGYSDLTTILNAITAKTNQVTYLYQIRNLMYKHSEQQKKDFIQSMFYDKKDLYCSDAIWLQKNRMEGIVCGGNIRCLLKLAGTPYFPDLTGKVLCLEANSGGVDVIISLLAQLKLMGAYRKVSGIVLGTFTELERVSNDAMIEEIVKRVIDNKDIPIARTKQIGHGTDSKALIIGAKMSIDHHGTIRYEM